MEGVRTCSCPQVILCYPWLCMYITGYPGISLANDAAPASPTRLAWRTLLICPWRTHGTRALMFFKCLLRPQNGRSPKNPSWTHGPDDIKACLVFFSAFEELKLQASGPIDSAKLYKQSPTPIMYVAPCELMLGRVPHFPCSLQGNATPGSRAHHTSQVVAPQGQRVSVRDRRCSRCGWP